MFTVKLTAKKSIDVGTLREASEECRQYIDGKGLGSSNWRGGEVYREGMLVARVSYNGKVWPPGQWVTGMQPLDLDAIA